MRPISLRMTAFGPFPGNEQIGFTSLGENPLFLINGPTGAGKTTILDAICFALYGKSTGDEREAAQMRCDLAESGSLTEVEFIFELSGKKYLIQRSPEQVRPKKNRVEEVTVQAPKAKFSELIKGGEERLIVAKRVSEATMEIERLTGLNADQFRQVMVLPQGRFRQLLMAESREREHIFSNLFQTRIYKQLEESLKNRAAAIRKEVEKHNQVCRGILEGAGVESIDAMSEEIKDLTTLKQQLEKDKIEKEKLFLDASSALQNGKIIFEQFEQLAFTKAEQTKLEERKPRILKLRERLQSAESALKLSTVYENANRCRSEKDAALEQENKARQKSLSLKMALEEAEQKLKEIEPISAQLDHLKKEGVQLDAYGARALKLTEALKEKQVAEEEKRKAKKLLETINMELQEVSKTRDSRETELKILQANQAELPGLQLNLKEAKDLLRKRSELEEKQKKITGLNSRLEQMEREGKKLAAVHESVLDDARDLEMRWHQGQAALLAKQLEADQPCPVCGSVEHPEPAISMDAIPTESDLKQAREKEQAAQKQLHDAKVIYFELKRDKENLDAVVDELKTDLAEQAERSHDELMRQHKQLQEKVEDLLKQQNKVDQLIEAVNKIKGEETSKKQKLEETNRRLTEKTAILAAKKAEFESAERELPKEYREPGYLQKRIDETRLSIEKNQQKITEIRKVHQDCMGESKAADAAHMAARDTKEQSGKNLIEAESKWDSFLKDSSFDSESVFLEALLDEEEIRDLKEEIESFEKQVNQTAGALKQQTSALEGKQKPDLAALQEKLAKSNEYKQAAEKAFRETEGRLVQVEAIRKKLEKTESERKKLEEEYSLIGTLSEVANGMTGNKVSLQRFVLSVLLDDVLIEASRRLRLMSKGRYQLLRKEDRAKGGRASGLDLEVEDAYSGKVRPVATLSGGESFMAALAMALGLSDVVQAYAGGIRLDTLFIDEGFGSLDPESLDLAIRTLIDLQSSGRMIGIISHVPDLQEQIATRVEVISTQKGSSIKLVS